MKRTIPFPLLTDRSHDLFDPSAQANLTVLHHPKKLHRTLDYNNTDPKVVRPHHAPVAVEYAKNHDPRFPESKSMREELREEKIALKDPQALERFLERQQKRLDHSMSSSPKYSATSSKAVQIGPVVAFPKAQRRLGVAGAATASASLVATPSTSPTPPLLLIDESLKLAVLPHIKGAVDMDLVTSRSGVAPRRAASSLDAPIASHTPTMDIQNDRQHEVRAASVPPPAMPQLGDFLMGGGGGGATQHLGDQPGKRSPTENHSPPSAPLDVMMAPASIAAASPQPHADTNNNNTAHLHGFFMTQKELCTIRDLQAPDFKKSIGRQKQPIGAKPNTVYPYDDPFSEKHIPLQVVAADVATQRRHIPCVVPIGKSGREPEQPPPIVPNDPLLKAAQRTQGEITDSLCPEFRIYENRKKALKVAELAKRAKLEADIMAGWSSQATELPFAVATNHSLEPSPVQSKQQHQRAIGGKHGAGAGAERHTSFAQSVGKEGHGGAGSSMLLALTPTAMERSLGALSIRSPQSNAAATETPVHSSRNGRGESPSHDTTRQDRGQSPVHKSSTKKKSSSRPLYRVGHGGGRLELDLDALFSGKRFRELLAMHDFMIERQLNGGTTAGERELAEEERRQESIRRHRGEEGEGNSHHDENNEATLSVAERMRRGLPVSFEQAYAEAERREHLLKLKCLSLTHDAHQVPLDSTMSPQKRRGTSTFGQGPERFTAASSPTHSLESQVTAGLQQLKQQDPIAKGFHNHLKLKEMYEKVKEDKETQKQDHQQSMRKLSMIR